MKRFLLILLAICMLAGCSHTENPEEIVWRYCKDKDEFELNKTFESAKNEIIVLTEDFIAVCKVNGNTVKTQSITELSAGFKEYKSNYDGFKASLKAELSPDKTRLLLWTNTELCVFDTGSYELNAFSGKIVPENIVGWIGSDAVLTLDGNYVSETSGGITLTSKGRKIPGKQVVARAGNRLYLKSNSGGVYAIVFGETEQVVNYDTISTQPVYCNEKYAVFSQTDGKYILDLTTGILKSAGVMVSGRIKSNNVCYVSDDHIIFKTTAGSKTNYSAYCISKDSRVDLPKTTFVRFDSGFSKTIMLFDLNYKGYFLKGTECRVAQSLEGVPNKNTYYIVELNAGVRYSVWGCDENGGVYEYTLDLLQ